MRAILKATRIHRTLTGLAAILVPVAFADRITPEVVIFAISAMLLYAGIGVQNAIKDNDYELPGHARYIVGAILLSSLIVASQNIRVLPFIVLYVILGFFYNNVSRYIMYGDVTTLSFTHHTLPTFATGYLLRLDWATVIKLSGFMFVVFWFLIHIKNLKDTEDDKRRGYKTLATRHPQGKKLTLMFFDIGYFLIVSAIALFNLGYMYMMFMIILWGLKTFIISQASEGKELAALDVMRLFVMVFLFALIFEKSTDLLILSLGGGLFIMYMVYLVPQWKTMILSS